jgi:hypothetical protein
VCCLLLEVLWLRSNEVLVPGTRPWYEVSKTTTVLAWLVSNSYSVKYLKYVEITSILKLFETFFLFDSTVPGVVLVLQYRGATFEKINPILIEYIPCCRAIFTPNV